jgi:hypothetical protein
VFEFPRPFLTFASFKGSFHWEAYQMNFPAKIILRSALHKSPSQIKIGLRRVIDLLYVFVFLQALQRMLRYAIGADSGGL